VSKGKIPSPHRESNPDNLIVQPVQLTYGHFLLVGEQRKEERETKNEIKVGLGEEKE
jgi:hypothetical protein